MVTLDAEVEEVHRTTKRAELTAFLRLLRGIVGPTTALLTTKDSLTGCGEEKYEVHRPKSEGRRLVDLDLGGGAPGSSRMNRAN